jgi:hypothetical protein
MTMSSLAQTVRGLGFASEKLRAWGRSAEFLGAVHAFLASGIPVVLGLRGSSTPGGFGHAVTAVGYELKNRQPLLQTERLPLRSARIRKLYVHDDRIGPYARAFLEVHPETAEYDEALFMRLEGKRSDDDDEPHEEHEVWIIDSAVVPLYPKIRLQPDALASQGEILGPRIEEVVGDDSAVNLEVGYFFRQSGTYLSELVAGPKSDLPDFLGRVTLSRWCGVLRWWLGDSPLADFVYDTTDLIRERTSIATQLLAGVVCYSAAHESGLRALAADFDALFVTLQ